MKKFFSTLLSLIILCSIAALAYYKKEFVLRQCDKVRGMYYVYKGDEAYKSYDMQRAIKYYNKGLSIFPNHYGAWYNLGNIYVEYEDYFSAISSYEQAFLRNPKMMVARMDYGIIISEKLGDFDAAIDQYDEIIKTKRNLVAIPYVYNNRISYKDNKAIAYYNKGVAYRLKSLYSNDNWEEQRIYLSRAIEAYKESLKISPNRYDTLYNLGLAYHITGNYNEAGRCYCKAIKNAPMRYEAHYNLAVLLRRMKHYKEAYDEIDKASTLVTALNENSMTQEFAAIMMNDLTRSVYASENRNYLQDIIDEEKAKTKKHMTKSSKDIGSKETKEDKQKDTITSTGINFVNGKIVATEELDKAILNNFGQCPSKALFIDDDI